MGAFDILSYGCWIVSALFLFWMVADFFKTNREHDEEFLLSSREAADEITEDERRLAEEREKNV